ncbi:MAG: GGDEF domain-containing protein [Huintestinicola sp.]|uniref:GGDEF domain-containing protein n=1 Tax=Huintestinicola sp. TaxID=2981661 RepID=UPI003F0FEC60
MIRWFVELNFPTLIILVFMSVFLMINSIFRRKINKTFGLSLIVTVTEMLAYSAELWIAENGGSTSLCIFFCAMGYAVRPIIIYLFVKLSIRNDNTSALFRRLILVPMFLNTLAAFSAFFTDIVYTYNSSNEFVRGPLGYFTHLVCIFYMILLMLLTIRRFCRRDYSEGLIIFLIVTVNIIAMYTESFIGMYGTGRSAYALSIVFYYLFFSVESFKRDPLTNALNRRCFYIDSEKHREELTAVVSIDLNDLKKINDTMGHAKGDEAICTAVNSIDKAVPKGCTLYRTGGDEFMILCIRKEKSDVERLLSDIRAELKKTPYTCAIGAAYTNGEELDSVCARADAEMYRDKQIYKSKAAM